MKLLWRLAKDGGSLDIMLVYNMYLRTKKVFVNNIEVVSLRKPVKNNIIEFKQDGRDYRLELTPEDFGYSGNLVTPDGETILGEHISREYVKTPLWVIPFILVNMSIPILSVEAFTPWLIGVAASYITAKILQLNKINTRKKILYSICIALLAWAAYFIYYLYVRRLGFDGGFIPFIK